MAAIENDAAPPPRPAFAAPKASLGRIVGIALVAALHAGIVYAAVTGLARSAIEVVRAPIVTRIIDEAPPAKPAPPPLAPRFTAPPLAFVPPPEIRIETPPPAPKAITAVTTAKPPPAPPAPAVATPARQPAAPPPHEAVRLEPRLDLAKSREPEYPPMSRRLGEQGALLVEVLVDGEGRAVEARLVQSSGFPRLDQAALAGVKDNYRFAPGTVDGKPAPMRFTFKFTWKLR